MAGKRVYLIRYGAYGDHLHMTPVLRAFKEEGWETTFEYNAKGLQIHAFNPWVDHHVFREPSRGLYENEEGACYEQYQRINRLKREYDRVVDFGGSLEKALIADEKSPDYFLSKEEREEKFGQISFHDQSIKWANLPEKYHGRKVEVYFRHKEHERVKEIMGPIREKYPFLMMWSIAGSMWQKAIYPWAREVCDEFMTRHPDVFLFLTCGPEYAANCWSGPRVYNCVEKKHPFRQVLLMTRYINMLVTPETGIGIGAGAYGTPKIMLMTAANLKNIVGNDENDYSLQSDAWCSPCHRAIYNMDHCDTEPVDLTCRVVHGDPSNPFHKTEEKKLPICVFFNKDRLLAQMEKIYALHHVPDWSAPADERLVYL